MSQWCLLSSALIFLLSSVWMCSSGFFMLCYVCFMWHFCVFCACYSMSEFAACGSIRPISVFSFVFLSYLTYFYQNSLMSPDFVHKNIKFPDITCLEQRTLHQPSTLNQCHIPLKEQQKKQRYWHCDCFLTRSFSSLQICLVSILTLILVGDITLWSSVMLRTKGRDLKMERQPLKPPQWQNHQALASRLCSLTGGRVICEIAESQV